MDNTDVSQALEKVNDTEREFEQITTAKFPNLTKNTNTQIKRADTLNRHINYTLKNNGQRKN